jgi:cold shock CspA family protein
MARSPLFHLALLGSSFLTACGSSEEATPTAAAPAHCLDTPADGSQRQKQQVLVTGHSIFEEDASGNPVPQPARMQIWCKNANGQWTSQIVDDPDSNVFHKIIPMDDGSLISIGAMGAKLKKWTATEGSWAAETLWERSWGGRFDRLRDIEIGDVDQDGKDEWVIATHDQGVVAVYNPDEGAEAIIEMDEKADTFVHEIEIGDLEGDGKLEFFATPSDRNQVGKSQKGAIVMYKFDGERYVKSVVEAKEGTHAKEILATDLNGDGKTELLGVFEAELSETGGINVPVQIRQYELQEDGSFTATVLAEIPDEMCRFLVAGDLDGDGEIEMVASAKKTGVYVLEAQADGTWSTENIDNKSSGFEHVTKLADMDQDGQLEIYIAADKQRTLSQYTWDSANQRYTKTFLGNLPNGFTWNMEDGSL